MDAAKDGLEHDEDDGEDHEQELIALVFQYFLFPCMNCCGRKSSNVIKCLSIAAVICF